MARQRFRILGLQPVPDCVHCKRPGPVRWRGSSYCHLHCSEEALVASLAWRSAEAVRSVLRSVYGDRYQIDVRITPKS
jgi:hypothetical protein